MTVAGVVVLVGTVGFIGKNKLFSRPRDHSTLIAIAIGLLGIAVTLMVAGLAELDGDAFPVAGTTQAVRIEGALGAANVTQGDTSYTKAVSAQSNDQIKLQAWYYNLENVASGLYAADLTVRFDVSTTRSTGQVTTVFITAANSNQVVASATVDVPPGHVLAFVPGSAKWRHNVGQDEAPDWVTVEISDEVVNAGVRLEDAPPCLQCEATVTVILTVTPV